MQNLIWEYFPLTRLGTGSQLKKAIILKCTSAYDDSLNYVPLSIRNQIPEHMKGDGTMHLTKGAEGFLYEVSPNKQRRMVIFKAPNTIRISSVSSSS